MDSKALDEAIGKLDKDTQRKIRACQEALRQAGRMLVAFSGGVDSTFLLALASATLGGQNVLAVLGVAPIFPVWERDEARELAGKLGVRLLELQTCQLDDPTFLANPKDRCYHCKLSTFGRLVELARQRGFDAVASGTNADDTGDYRPGLKAEEELGILRPLLDAGLRKKEIRAASAALGLATWAKPTYACLATRIPYGQPITAARLLRIEQAELALRELGFAGSRVRDHDDVARLEVPAELIERAAGMREQIVQRLKKLGFSYVALDLEGYRTGSMNEVI